MYEDQAIFMPGINIGKEHLIQNRTIIWHNPTVMLMVSDGKWSGTALQSMCSKEDNSCSSKGTSDSPSAPTNSADKRFLTRCLVYVPARTGEGDTWQRNFYEALFNAITIMWTSAVGVIYRWRMLRLIKQTPRMVAQARHVLRDEDLLRKYLMQ